MELSPPDLIEQGLSALGAETGLSLALDDQGLCALKHADGFAFTL